MATQYETVTVHGRKWSVAIDPEMTEIISAETDSCCRHVIFGRIKDNGDKTFNIVWNDERGSDETPDQVLTLKYRTAEGDKVSWHYGVPMPYNEDVDFSDESTFVTRLVDPDFLGTLWDNGIGTSVQIYLSQPEPDGRRDACIFLKMNKEKDLVVRKEERDYWGGPGARPVLNVYLDVPSKEYITSGPYPNLE